MFQYLDFDNLPDTNFSCVGKVIGGYYADLETSCQMFHVCTIGQHNEPMDIRFLCLNGTVFDQVSYKKVKAHQNSLCFLSTIDEHCQCGLFVVVRHVQRITASCHVCNFLRVHIMLHLKRVFLMVLIRNNRI